MERIPRVEWDWARGVVGILVVLDRELRFDTWCVSFYYRKRALVGSYGGLWQDCTIEKFHLPLFMGEKTRRGLDEDRGANQQFMTDSSACML